MPTANEIRQKYLDFFRNRGHVVIPSAPLVPENDPTTLFTSSGMQPLVPYLLGQPHPNGVRLVDSQKSFRAQDIEEVGDNRHTTFFEMLGNWSLGDYFKQEQLSWFYEFLTGELSLDPARLFVSVFEGNDQVPKDTVSAQIWKQLGIPENRIYYYGVNKNWWSRSGPPDQMPAGEPGGPDSEVFYDFGTPHDPRFGSHCHPNCDCGRFIEIGNSVFMQYQKQSDGSLKDLPSKNVDFGGGLERLTAAVLHEPDIFRIDLFWPLIDIFQKVTAKSYVGSNIPAMRIAADHLKAACFLISDGVHPSNKTQGYILRRLIRRASLKLHQLNPEFRYHIPDICSRVVNLYQEVYFNSARYFENTDDLWVPIQVEVEKFLKTLEKGLREISKRNSFDAQAVFDLHQTYGFPVELALEILAEKGIKIDPGHLAQEKARHQDTSRSASAGMFKGGLQDQSDTVVKYHTATHLLHWALREILGSHVSQKGSNITAERLRFDFSHPEKLSLGQISRVEDLINQRIAENHPVVVREMDKDAALSEGALAFFPEKYPDRTTVYSIGNFSKELCGGPHVNSTGEIGRIKIIKEESAGAGIRRIYAQLEAPAS